MLIGGSTAFRTMTILPRSAPPTRSTARVVLVVNSSMFRRVERRLQAFRLDQFR